MLITGLPVTKPDESHMVSNRKIVMFLIRLRLIFMAYFKKGWHSKVSHSFMFRIRALLTGFWPDSLMIYRLRGWNNKLIINDYTRSVRMALINYPDHVLIDDKLAFEKTFPGTITSKALIYNRRIVPTSPDGIKSVEELAGQIEQADEFILKPRSGGGGYGIRVVKKQEKAFRIGKEVCQHQEFSDKILSFHNCLIYSMFNQAGFSHEIYPLTLNTIRLLTIIDKNSGEPVLLRALHRFGTKRSVPVDNWSSGGICSSIDLDSGCLGPAIAFPYDRKLSIHAVHPDTGKQIEGSSVPVWNKITSHVLNLHATIPFLPYIGWDIVLSDRKVHILETNSNSDVNLFQVHEPLLSNDLARSIFKSYGVIK